MQDFEIICVDDASTDGTYEVLCDYSSKHSNIVCIRNAINRGAAFSRNRGLELSRGEYVIFLDSDDTYHSQLLEKLYAAAQKESADVAICKVNYYDKKGNIIICSGWNESLFQTNCISVEDNRENIFQGILYAPWNKLVRRQFILENSIEFQDLPMTNDVYQSMMIIACAQKIVLISDVLVYYQYERDGNITESVLKKGSHIARAFEEVIKGLRERELWFGDIRKSAINVIVARCYDDITKSPELLAKRYYDEYQNRIRPLLVDREVQQDAFSRWEYYEYLYLNGKREFCENIYQLHINEITGYFEKFKTDTIALWGAGKLGRSFLMALPKSQNFIRFVVDNDRDKQGKCLNGIAICDYEEVKDSVDKYLVLNERYIDSIIQQIGEADKIINMQQILKTFKI